MFHQTHPRTTRPGGREATTCFCQSSHARNYPYGVRRLLVGVVTILTVAVLWAAGSMPARASGTARVPVGVRQIVVTLSFLPSGDGHHRSRERTLTRRASVREVVQAADRLTPAVIRGACPLFMRLGPDLTVVFRGGRRDRLTLAQARVQVVLGRHGDSGASACFPIYFTAGRGGEEPLVGNGFVRLVGRLIGQAIS